MIRFLLALFGALVGMGITLPVLAVALPFAVVAWLTRAVARWTEPRTASMDECIEFDPTFGWRPKPNLSTFQMADDVFSLTTDADGWRGAGTVAESELVVLGDSFAWGHGMDDAHFFANASRRPRIKAVGVDGYSQVQQLQWLQRLAPQLRDKLVVWFIYYGNDLVDNLSPHMQGYRAPFARQRNGREDWEIVTRHLSPEPWTVATRRSRRGDHYYECLAALCTPGHFSQRAYAACEFLLRQGRDICRGAGARLVVLGIPDPTQMSERGHRFLISELGNGACFNPNYPDERLRAICERLEIPFLALKEHLDLDCYKDGDCHWNEKGHRRVARLLADLHARLGKDGARVS